MTQTTVDRLNCHRFILADIVPPNRQERVVRRIVVCTVQLQGFSRSSNRFSVAASRLPHSQSMRQSDQKPTRSTACSFFEGNARARPIPSQPRSRPAPVEGAPRALPHELGSNSRVFRRNVGFDKNHLHALKCLQAPSNAYPSVRRSAGHNPLREKTLPTN